MQAEHLAPIVMVRNEELWLARVLRPLAEVFTHVLVGDTGSTDRTVEIARSVPGVTVLEYGPRTPAQLGQVRAAMGRQVAAYGAAWAFQVDGDELYHVDALRHIAALDLGAAPAAWFTTLISLDQDPDGALWLLDDLFARLAVFPAGTAFYGAYPFECPAVFREPSTFRYCPLLPNMPFHGVHLHRLVRSSQDGEVYLRRQKQFQFAMREKTVPRIARCDLAGWEATRWAV
jgi:glycosyltransferase involved in cell wall biosynthesis